MAKTLPSISVTDEQYTRLAKDAREAAYATIRDAEAAATDNPDNV